ncbi:MAG: hypothetical protein HKO59_07295 [Phycisphaerales bacterium]|nr:hypothetical protein [Phycisphaerae bacterium]NNM25780.1 hypothetical protein [Phycisphaerales bacterium]
MSRVDDADLVTLTHAGTATEAHAIVSVLHAAGIEAVAFDTATTGIGVSLRPGRPHVPVQVRQADVQTARETLQANAETAAAIDWSTVELGEREDDHPPATPGRMPPAARVALVVTIAVAVIALVGVIWMALA